LNVCIEGEEKKTSNSHEKDQPKVNPFGEARPRDEKEFVKKKV